MLEEIQVDLKVYQDNTNLPIMHRVKCSNRSNFYLTKSILTKYDNSMILGKNTSGNYRIFPWNHIEAEEILTKELGETMNERSGVVTMTGNYLPNGSDLEDIQYDTEDGKYYFESAQNIIKNGISSSQNERHHIDSRTFMQMNEVIPTGAQGKAIYAKGNHIIDGPAGTGKSTTVLQKLTVLQQQGNTRAIILVKNKKVVDNFHQLLTNLDLKNIEIISVDQFISRINKDTKTISPTLLSNVRQDADILRNEIEQSVRIAEPAASNRLREHILKQDDLNKLFVNFKKIVEKKDSRKSNLSKLNNEWDEIDKLRRSTLINEINRRRENKTHKRIGSNKRARLIPDTDTAEILKIADDQEINNLLQNITKDGAINKQQRKIKKQTKQLDVLDKKKQSLTKKIKTQTKQLIARASEIKYILCSTEFIGKLVNDQLEARLIAAKLKKRLMGTSEYDYIIIDEAQDVELEKIEAAMIFAKNTILTGDPLQNENKAGIGTWDNMKHLQEEFVNDNGELNIFQLNHNFRQTCELGNFSYNYRQHLLEQRSVNLQRDYFENQKGFWKPSIHKIDDPGKFTKLIKNKVDLMKKHFTDTFDIVVIYENEEARKRISEFIPNNSPVELININEIAGREFPIIIAPLLESTSAETIYIMISRAQYDLTLTTKSTITSPAIEKLINEQYLDYYK